MITRSDIHELLRKACVRRDGTVLLHTSMRALGPVEGGCDGLIDGFCSYLSEGLLLIPTHTWDNVTAEQPVFDVRTTPPCIGALPTVAAFRPDGVRSLHPTHSLTGFGARAAEFLAGEEKAASPCPPGGAWARLYDEDATVLLLGVGLNRNTYLHAVDELLDLPNRLAEPIPLTVIDRAGRRYALTFRKHAEFTGSEFFENYRAPLEALGALTTLRLGSAAVGVFSVRRGTDVIRALWEKALAVRPDCNLCGGAQEIPREYYPDL